MLDRFFKMEWAGSLEEERQVSMRERTVQADMRRFRRAEFV